MSYLHIGNNVMIPDHRIIGIFDLDNTSTSKHTRAYLERAQREGRIVDVSSDLPRSFVVTSEQGRETVYLTQISSRTLLRRAEEGTLE